MAETRRSFLGKLAMFMAAGAPLASEAAPKKPSQTIERGSLKKKAKLIYPSNPKKSTASQSPSTPPKRTFASEEENLAQLYMPLCAHLEGDIPFGYNDKNHPTIGCGVHFKNFEELNNLPAIKITPKKGCKLSLDKAYLERAANADWNNPKTKAMFPQIEKVETVKLKDCSGEFPKSKSETWDKELFWIPKATRNKANRHAVDFCIDKAKEIHPNLFQLPPSLRLVVVDLVYNLGDAKYKDEYPNFQAAIRKTNLANAKEECGTKNLRRDTVKKLLIESAILAKKNPQLSEEGIRKLHRRDIKRDNALSPTREVALWREIDKCTEANCAWNKTQILLTQRAHQKLSKRS